MRIWRHEKSIPYSCWYRPAPKRCGDLRRHYERPDKTAVYFAMKGFRVVTCPWRVSASGIAQVNDMVSFREGSTPEMKNRFLGIVETTWSQTQSFLNGYYGVGPKGPVREHTAWKSFKEVFQKIDSLGN